MSFESCFICGRSERKYKEATYPAFNKKISKTNENGLVIQFSCEYFWCGKYVITQEAIEYLDNLSPKEKEQKYKIQSYIREQNDKFNDIPELTEEKVKQIINLPNKTLKEQFDLFLLNINKFNLYGKSSTTHEDNFEILRIRSWIANKNIMFKIAEKVKEKNYLTMNLYTYSYDFNVGEITFDGLEYIESLQQPNKNSKKIFLAFKFNEKNKIIFNNLADKIKELELNPVIVNQNTTYHNEKIGDKIIVELKSSRILVADLTEHSPNVYYEIGYAMGMGIPVILTCKKEYIDNLAFDINQYPVFEWENGEELMKKVLDRIKVIL